MDIIYFLTSINKLSLLAFLITLGVLIYEINLLKKEGLSKTKPKIPKFEESTTATNIQATPLIIDQPEKITKPNNLILVVLIVFLVVFGLATFYGFYNYNQKKSQDAVSPTPMVNFITSKGIKIFNGEFNPLSDSELSQIKPAEEIIIGVKTIKGVDIDRARIRVNKDSWQDQDITVDFSPKDEIYYIKYQIASDESKLKIEAQLHSTSEGWLGD